MNEKIQSQDTIREEYIREESGRMQSKVKAQLEKKLVAECTKSFSKFIRMMRLAYRPLFRLLNS